MEDLGQTLIPVYRVLEKLNPNHKVLKDITIKPSKDGGGEIIEYSNLELFKARYGSIKEIADNTYLTELQRITGQALAKRIKEAQEKLNNQNHFLLDLVSVSDTPQGLEIVCDGKFNHKRNYPQFGIKEEKLLAYLLDLEALIKPFLPNELRHM